MTVHPKTVHVGWEGLDVDSRPFEHEMRRSTIVLDWDDGRGNCPWYNAVRGPEERALRKRVEVLLGARPSKVLV